MTKINRLKIEIQILKKAQKTLKVNNLILKKEKELKFFLENSGIIKKRKKKKGFFRKLVNILIRPSFLILFCFLIAFLSIFLSIYYKNF